MVKVPLVPLEKEEEDHSNPGNDRLDDLEGEGGGCL